MKPQNDNWIQKQKWYAYMVANLQQIVKWMLTDQMSRVYTNTIYIIHRIFRTEMNRDINLILYWLCSMTKCKCTPVG